jgi:hypothetical protein
MAILPMGPSPSDFGKCVSNKFGKILFQSFSAIPAKAEIQFLQFLLGSRFRGSDGLLEFFRALLI